MYTASSTTQPATGGIFPMLRRGGAWLDDRGRKAWYAAMILGFIFAWPVGLGLLAYMIWSKRMFGRNTCGTGRHHDHNDQMHQHWDQMRHNWRDMGRAMRPSGNTAFDTYKADTIRRLQAEQEAFEAFLQRLRDAKDKSEFDTFMEDRTRANAEAASVPVAEAAPAARSGEY